MKQKFAFMAGCALSVATSFAQINTSLTGLVKDTTDSIITEAKVPGITPEKFAELANKAKAECPVSKALGAINRSGYRGYAKTYDAVAHMMVDYDFFEIGIEYERTLKASEKYLELVRILEAEPRADVILYLFSDEQIGSILQWIFRNTRKEILLAQQEEFVRHALDTPAICRCLRTTLRDSLRRIRIQKSIRQ